MNEKFNPILPCEQNELLAVDIVAPAISDSPEVTSAVWKDAKEKSNIEFIAISKTVCIEVKTKGFGKEMNVTIEILEDKKDSPVLHTLDVVINNNEGITESDGENSITIKEEWKNKSLVIKIKSEKTKDFNGEKIQVVCCDQSIKKGDSGDFIEELNIRLCGFGGIQPERTVKDKMINSIKQFQKDYMNVAETGCICKHVLESLDEFKDKYSIPIDQLKCTCESDGIDVLNHVTGNKEKGSCKGFGNTNDRKYGILLSRPESNPEVETVKLKDGTEKTSVKETIYTVESSFSKYVLAYNKEGSKKKNKDWMSTDENNQVKTKKSIAKLKYISTTNYSSLLHCYEYPGMHRSLMWAYKALQFYLEKTYGKTESKYTVNKISSGYRCRYQSTFQSAQSGLTFNHMGTAIDIHFDLNGERTKKTSDMDKIRKDICNKYLGAHLGWSSGKLGLELTSHGADSWVHLDCREFKKYKNNKFFAQTLDDMNGEKLVDLIKTIDDGKFKSIIE